MSKVVVYGMDSDSGLAQIVGPEDVVYIPSGAINTSGRSIQTTTFTSGTGKQVSSTVDVDMAIPITYNPTGLAAATCVLAFSPDGTTYTNVVTESLPIGLTFDGTVRSLWPHVPAGYYVKLTVTNAVIGTASYW